MYETTYFVRSDDEWSAKDSMAVEEAGGKVFLVHEKTGMALVTSSDSEFLSNTGSHFSFAAEDKAIDFGLETGDTEHQVYEEGIEEEGLQEQIVTPEDETFYGYQWNMQSESIDAAGAWAAGCDGAGARVAVIDGGISRNHLDISPNLDRSCSFSTVAGLSYYQDQPGFRHATHVAGIIAAAGNGRGTIGVAPSATLMAVKALHGGSGSFGSVIMAILFAADPESFAAFGTDCTKRADIINMSLGGGALKRNLRGFHHHILKAMNYAASKGVLVISSAGNSSIDLGQAKNLLVFPGTLGSGLSVSATGPVGFAQGATNFRDLSSYTNFGEGFIDLAGPGGDFQLYPTSGWHLDMVLSPSYVEGSTHFYAWAAGTSMASPAVAGVAALIKGATPGISLGALKAKLKNTADDEGKVGNDEFYGHGFVNAYRACVE